VPCYQWADLEQLYDLRREDLFVPRDKAILS